jgi:hypothetical protein
MGNCVVVAPVGTSLVLVTTPGHEQHHAVVVADRGNRSQHVASEGQLPARALHVDDRALARDDDRFLERAQSHLGIDDGREGSRELDSFPLEDTEPCERERDGVGARTQVFDPVLSRSIGHCCANLLDEGRTRSFDCHPGENRPRCVTHRPCDDRLCRRRRGKEDEPRKCDPDDCAHVSPRL